MKKHYTFFCLLFLTGVIAHPQDLANRLRDELETQAGETLGAYYERALDLLNPDAGSEALVDATTRQASSEAAKVTGNQPGLVGAPSGFGTRVGGELVTNFQPLFGFAINAVNTGDDGKSVTVDFNPVRVGIYGAVKISATIIEPVPNEMLLQEILEDSREAQKEEISKQLNDFDDIDWSLTYGYQRGSGEDWSGRRRLWGRSPKLYEGFIRSLLDASWRLAFEAETLAPDSGADDALEQITVWLFEKFSENAETKALALGNILDLTFEQVETAGIPRAEMETALLEDVLRFYNLDRAFASVRLREFGDLIDDQPTATITASYRNRDELVGPDAAAATFKLEFGRFNVNRVRKEMNNHGRSIIEAYRWVASQREHKPKDRFSLVINYKWVEEIYVTYSYLQMVTDAATGEVSSVPRESTIMKGNSQELTAKLAYSLSIKRQMRSIEGAKISPRIVFSVERVDIRNDEARQDRWIGKLVYNFPLAAGLSLPVTLTYASDPEFLGEQDQEFSVYLGLNYGLDRLFE